MATVDFFELHPGIGSVWARAMALWASWLQASNPPSAISVGTVLGYRMIQISQVVGPDTNRYNLCAMDIAGTNVSVPLPQIMTSPGWNSTPPILLSTYGATTTRTSWTSTMLNVRASVWNTLMGVTGIAYTTTDYTDALTGLRLVHSVATVRKLGCIGVDCMLLGVTDGTLAARTTVVSTPTDGRVVSAPGGSSIVNLDPLVSAVEDVAAVDLTYEINNGDALFTIRGRAR